MKIPSLRCTRSPALAVGFMALTLSAPVAAVPHDAGARRPNDPTPQRPIACRDIGQNQLTIQFQPALGITADAWGHLVAATPSRLTLAQIAELQRLQSRSAMQWRSAIDPATLAALRARDAGSLMVARSLVQLAAFMRVTVGGAPQRGAAVHTSTPFDNLPVMSPTVCASTASLLREPRAMNLVVSATVSEIPAPPPSVP